MLWQWSVGHRDDVGQWMSFESKASAPGAKIQGPTGVVERWREGIEYKTMRTYAFFWERVQTYQQSRWLKESEDLNLRNFSSWETAQLRDHQTQPALSLPAPGKSKSTNPGRGEIRPRLLPLWARVRGLPAHRLWPAPPYASVPTLVEHGTASHHGRRHVGRTTTLSMAATADTDRRGRSRRSKSAAWFRLPAFLEAGAAGRLSQVPLFGHWHRPLAPSPALGPRPPPCVWRLQNSGHPRIKFLTIVAGVWKPSV